MRKWLLILIDLGPLIIWLPIRLILTLISTCLTTSAIKNQRKVTKLLIILISLRAILQITQSYISPLRLCMPTFKIPMELKLKILTGLVIKSLIITITKVRIGVHTCSLIKRLISKKYSYSLYYKAAYFKQQLCLPCNQVSVISIILQLITIGRFKRALAPLHYELILMERQKPVNYILLLSSLLQFVIQ